jgi:arylsulfatase A-like enzyme
MTNSRPNILWISFEDTYPFYGCYGDAAARTPALDRLAGEGCLWPNAFSTAAVCAPARCAVITGMYAIAIGAHHMRTSHCNPHTPELPTPYETVPPPHVKCFTEYLRAAGYYCTNNEKTDYQFAAPRTAWDECHTSAHWRSRPDPAQPFFAVFNLTPSHESGAWAGKAYAPEFDPASLPVPAWLPDTPKTRESLARMYTHIADNDRRLAELLAQLEADGLAQNTIVVHWSDHGPLPRGKRWPYDSGLRVPLIVRWPGRVEPGTRCDALVSTIDLAPTMLSLAGVGVPRHLQGQVFCGPDAAPGRKYIFASRDRHDSAYDRVRAARDGRFKYIRNYHPELGRAGWVPYLNRHPIMQEMWRLHLDGSLPRKIDQFFDTPRPPEELYDTQADPDELANLAEHPEHQAELNRLRAALDDWLQAVGDMGDIPEAEMVRRWWPGGKQPTTAAPLFIPINLDHYGMEPVEGGVALPRPARVQLHCATEGASIAYTYETGDAARWNLYTVPLDPPAGSSVLRARAIRIGYRESEERRLELSVN